MESFDKHGWLKAVQADGRFTDREFRLAFVLCNQFTRRDGTGWPVELERIAATITGGFTGVKLSKGLLKLCRAGYLVETYRRSTGPGLPARRSHDLLRPDQNTATTELHCSDNTEPVELNTDTAGSITETLGSNTDTPGFNTDTLEFVETIADQPKDTPKGTLEDTNKGTAQDTYVGITKDEGATVPTAPHPGGFTCTRCSRDFDGEPSALSGPYCHDCMLEELRRMEKEEASA